MIIDRNNLPEGCIKESLELECFFCDTPITSIQIIKRSILEKTGPLSLGQSRLDLLIKTAKKMREDKCQYFLYEVVFWQGEKIRNQLLFETRETAVKFAKEIWLENQKGNNNG